MHLRGTIQFALLSPKGHQTLDWDWKHHPRFEAGSSVYWFEYLSLYTIRFFSFLLSNNSCCYCYLLFCLFNLELGLSSIRFRKQNYIPRLGTSQIQIASHRLHKVILHCSCGYTWFIPFILGNFTALVVWWLERRSINWFALKKEAGPVLITHWHRWGTTDKLEPWLVILGQEVRVHRLAMS